MVPQDIRELLDDMDRAALGGAVRFVPPAISDPRRLLAGFTFTPDPFLPCYVLGCPAEAVIGAVHRIHGRVDSCPTHDPARMDYARVLGHPAPTPEPPPAPPAPPSNGAAVPLSPKPFTRPPAGQFADIPF